MKKLLILIIVNFAVALFQTAFFPELFGNHALINWVLMLGFAWLLLDAPITSLKSVFVGGLIIDMLINGHLGISSLLFTAMVYTLNLIRKYVFKGLGPHFVIAALFCYIYSLIIFNQPISMNWRLVVFAVVTSLLSCPLSMLMRQLVIAGKK